MVSETAREREVHSYYQTWMESSIGFDASESDNAGDHLHLDGSKFRQSKDKALIAFAQLGCLRLNAKRGVVNLISSTRLYVVAEATKSLSLITHLTESEERDELWFGNCSLPRSQSISEYVLESPSYTAVGAYGNTYTAPALIVNDVTKDRRFQDRAYAGNGITFYSGVPIVSNKGFIIGAYTVTDDKPRDGLTPVELAFMQDMSKVVMRHLESVKNDVARFRGERMVLGLGNLLKGKRSIHGEAPEKLIGESAPAKEETSDIPVEEHNSTRDFKGMTITNADPKNLRHSQGSGNAVESVSAKIEPNSRVLTEESGPDSRRQSLSDTKRQENDDAKTAKREGTPQKSISFSHRPADKPKPLANEKIRMLFGRAANLLLECVGADGIVFFDATSTKIEKHSNIAKFKSALDSQESLSGASEGSYSEISDDSSSNPSTDSEGSEDSRRRMLKSKGPKCQMLGYAFDISSESTANVNTIGTLALSGHSLTRFIRRYPCGKSFFFNVEGNLYTSEGEFSDSSTPRRSKAPILDAAMRLKGNKRSSKAIAAELIRVIPGARNVIWLPLWDFTKQRWCAGMFLWSRHPEKLLTVQDDMVYFKTFGASLMTEVSRLDAQSADEAKTTFIANISHELRSPLHGILGSVEFLQDTTLNAFQSSMASAVETCAKTLLDTVEHVLDYAKINQMSAIFAKRLKFHDSDNPVSRSTEPTLEDDLDLAIVVEEAVEAVYAGLTFRNVQAFEKQSLPRARARSQTRGTNQVPEDKPQLSSSKLSRSVNLILAVEKQNNWWVRTQPGAIKRIIMNTLGNALKYTDKGIVTVSLTSIENPSRASEKKEICLTVQDTGRGMSANFLQNHAFTPFSQESQFSEGTGLGLSIVRQIVNSLHGRLELHSEKDVGTEIKVFLDLPSLPVPTPSSSTSFLSIMIQRTHGMTLCLVDPFLDDDGPTENNLQRKIVEDSFQQLARRWFGMEITTATSMEGVSTDFFVYTEPPPIEYIAHLKDGHDRNSEAPIIVIAANAFECAALIASGTNNLNNLSRVVDVISQPCGPQKLAKAFHRCFTRLESMPPNPKNMSTSETAVPQTPEPQKRPRASLNAAPSKSAVIGSDTDSSPILLVDDNEINLNLLVAFVKKCGHTYFKAKDGLEAVQAFENARANPRTAFKYVLMDISMPVMDGITATRKIRSNEKKGKGTNPATIIMLTGLAAESSRKESFDAGADYYLAKPVKFKQLEELLSTK